MSFFNLHRSVVGFVFYSPAVTSVIIPVVDIKSKDGRIIFTVQKNKCVRLNSHTQSVSLPIGNRGVKNVA